MFLKSGSFAVLSSGAPPCENTIIRQILGEDTTNGIFVWRPATRKHDKVDTVV